MCPECAEKVNRTYIMHWVGQEFMGMCSLCMSKTIVKQYEIGLTYGEAERRRRKRLAEGKKKQRISGERGRAERSGGYGKAL